MVKKITKQDKENKDHNTSKLPKKVLGPTTQELLDNEEEIYKLADEFLPKNIVSSNWKKVKVSKKVKATIWDLLWKIKELKNKKRK